MMLVVVTQEIGKETFLLNELNEIASHFSRVIIISTIKGKKTTHKYETIVSKRTDYVLSSILYSITKLFSKETLQEVAERKKMRAKPGLKLMVNSWIQTWMIEKRLSKYLATIWNGEEEIILYSYWLNVYAYFVANIKKRNPHITAISRVHGFEIRDFNTYIPFRKKIDSYLDKIIFISNYTQREYESIMMGIKKKVRAEQRVMRLGVNNSTIPSSKIFGHNILNIASCSGVYSLKRLDLIIDSLAEVSESVKLNWIHFGSGSDLDITLDYARKKLIKSNISFKFKGEVDNLQVLKYYKENQIHLFINTSDYEGIPVSIMEAMSYGIPCIARDIGGNSEIVVNHVSGRLLPKDAAPTFIADAIEEFYLMIKNNTQDYLALRSSTYNYWKNNYNAIINYNSFLNYIFNKRVANVR